MTRLRFFIRRYWPEFATAVVAILLAMFSYRFATKPGAQLVASVVITVLATWGIVALRSRETPFHFLPLDHPEAKNAWVGYGVFEYTRTDRCFRITQSDTGHIFARALNWSDYRLTFEFKILRTSLGVIVRAVNLSNLVMLQIVENGICPHFRISGIWKPWKAAEAGLTFAQPLKFGEWYRCEVQCDKAAVRICISRNGSQVSDQAWTITPATLQFVVATDGDGAPTHTVPVPAMFEYGTVGFRNHGDELALVRNFVLERYRS